MKPSLQRIVLAAALLSLPASAAFAGPVDACVDLGPGHEVSRFGTQYALVKDGEAYYRLGFRRDCGGLSLAPRIHVSAEKQAGRLCPTGTWVDAGRDRCEATSVDRIDEAAYKRYRGRR